MCDREARIAARQAEDEARQVWLADLNNNYLTDEKGLMMPRPKGSKNVKSTEKDKPREGLLAALEFVGVAGTKDFEVYQRHVTLLGNMAIMTDGQIAAGHPITEDLSCCPNFRQLVTALRKAGAATISELDIGRLSIKGGKLRAIVPCLPDLSLCVATPDAPVAPIDDRLKLAFGICGTVASEAAEEAFQASLLLGANTVTATNRVVMLQAWHGIDLPPGMVLPKLFTEAVRKIGKPLQAFGYAWDGQRINSVTFWFEGNCWIKTQCYADEWPVESIPTILDVAATPVATPGDFFEACATVAEFAKDHAIWLVDGKVQSHLSTEIGAQYPVKDLPGGKILSSKQLRYIAPYAEALDLTSWENRVLFFGSVSEGEREDKLTVHLRGAVACIEPGELEEQPEVNTINPEVWVRPTGTEPCAECGQPFENGACLCPPEEPAPQQQPGSNW